MPKDYQVVDLFAGPGGLAEGFSAFTDIGGEHPFNVTLSVEKEHAAHKTLQLRAFLRQFDEFPPEYYAALNNGRALPDWSRLYSGEWESAEEEALKLELGTASASAVVDRRIDWLKELGVGTVLIGGPPCQAYSLVGRARNQGKEDYVPKDDHRHFLYREYISILRKLRPVAFVMENVKGMLSSSMDGRRIFEQVLQDLRAADGHPDSYVLYAISRRSDGRMTLTRTARHQDFIVRAEHFGVPQARHRVIIVGLRKDISDRIPAKPDVATKAQSVAATVRNVLSGLPALRSGLSRGDAEEAWREVVHRQMDIVLDALQGRYAITPQLLAAAWAARNEFVATDAGLPRTSARQAEPEVSCPNALSNWLTDDRLSVTLNHASRGHMPEDLARYFFSAVFTAANGRAPKADEFPRALAPDHANWHSGKFADRFRTQGWDQPSTTVTSHISKDGHYFIHPDPQQCRALTVREAARLQTFPDNYLFLGNRTEQYVQVGNAVPPFLALQIAEVLADVLTIAG